MALDPTISLAIKPMQIEVPNQAEAMGKMQNLIAMRNQNAMAPGQLQAQQLENQQRGMAVQQGQLDMEDQAKFRKVYADAGGDPEKLFPAAAAAGVGPKILLPMREQLMKLATEKAGLDEKTLANHASKNDQLSALMQPVTAETDPVKQEALWNSQQQEGLRQGVLTPQEVQQHPYPGSPEAVKNYASTLVTDKWVTSQAAQLKAQAAADADKREAALQPSKVVEAQSAAEFAQRKQNAPRLAAAAQAGPDKLAAELAATPPDQAKPFLGLTDPTKIMRVGMTPSESAGAETAAKNAENNVSEYELRLRAAKGDQQAATALAAAQSDKIRVSQTEAQNKWNLQMGAMTSADGKPSEMAQSVADYKVPMAQAFARLPGPAREILMRQVKQVNPDFDASHYDVARKTEMDATTGKLAQTSNAQSTALAHLDVLHQAIRGLKNGDIKVLNQLGNSMGLQTGNNAKTIYDAIVHKVGPELSSAYLAGGGSVGERGATEKDFDSSFAPDQLESNVAVSAKLLGGKIKANQDQYSRGTYGRGKQELITKEAKDALERLSGGTAHPAAGTVQDGYKFKGGDASKPENWVKQ